jgi:hypothetical protein
MAFITKIEDDQHRELAELVNTHHRYRFADGFIMFIATSPAWCRACQAFVLVEKLVDPAEKESRAREFFAMYESEPLFSLNHAPADEKHERNRKWLSESLHEAQRWRIALSERNSPPRCLECGGIDFTTIPEDGKWAPHPRVPGCNVRVPNDEICHVSRRYAGWFYDTEGRRIED